MPMSERPPSPSSNQAVEKAIFAFQMLRFDEAERLASGVLKSNRNSIAAAQVLGRVLIMQNRHAEAIAPLQSAARRTSDPEIETMLSVALASVGRDDEALSQLRQTAARRPPFQPAFLEFANQLGKAGRFDEGVAVLEEGLALIPHAVDMKMGLGYLQLRRNDRDKARALFSQVRAADPGRHEAHVALAKVMA